MGQIDLQIFHHHKLDSYLQRSIKDPSNLVRGGISSMLQQIFINCPFLFPFETKELYFKLISFVSSIDMHRSIYFMRQYLKKHMGAGNVLGEKDNVKKIAKQKVIIKRDKLIQSAFLLISKIDKRSFLDFEFQGEEGTGLGPTLEFYDNIAEEFKTWELEVKEGVLFKMWRLTKENLLFPSPLCIETFEQDKIKEIYEIYRLCGTIVAKAIVDDRQIDLPVSPLFWKLCLGRKLTLFDLKTLDESVFKTMSEFQIIANKLHEIEDRFQSQKVDEEEKKRLREELTLTNGSKIEDYSLDFTLPLYSHIGLIPGGEN
mmetsp:Transcript_15893/g.26788  ORF Transcript_15893/g.26788 Transcript_15893/m.26788 type:complete len:315 (-) Transcript_15893:624-1568(-)